MIHNLNEAIVRIRAAGATNVRTVPMDGQHVTEGKYRVEICENGTWSPIIVGIAKSTADDLVTQATSRVILG